MIVLLSPWQDEGWKLNRNHYYQSGWLATGNVRGIVGVSYTTSHWRRCNSANDVPARSNYNLRGHRSQVSKEGKGQIIKYFRLKG